MQTALDSPSLKKKTDWLKLLSILYLAIPMLIFVLGYCHWYISIPFTLIECWVLVRVVLNSIRTPSDIKTSIKEWLPALLILAIWVLLSGIGGYAFQNPDHNFRNAIFHDLIDHNWPILYKQEIDGEIQTYGLVYYIGYWLPSALIGKMLGWNFGNLFLCLWTLTGVGFTLVFLVRKLSASPLFCTFLLVGFSGMDFLGVLILSFFSRGTSLWPPVSHLEWWAVFFQYSSNTTQLFWVFNQAIPCWLGLMLILDQDNRSFMLYLWTLVFFFAPIPAVGMLPYVLLLIFKSINIHNFRAKRNTNPRRSFFGKMKEVFLGIFTSANTIGSYSVLLVSLPYFAANRAGTLALFRIDQGRFIYFIFFNICEFLCLWLLLSQIHKNDLWWYICGGLLLAIPMFVIGIGGDFVMRASIPSLFILMIWSGEFLIIKPKLFLQPLLILCLLIGSITPLFEINRSLVRTFNYYTQADKNNPITFDPLKPKEPTIFSINLERPEISHLDSLVADEYHSLTYFELNSLVNFVSRVDDNLFFVYIAK